MFTSQPEKDIPLFCADIALVIFKTGASLNLLQRKELYQYNPTFSGDKQDSVRLYFDICSSSPTAPASPAPTSFLNYLAGSSSGPSRPLMPLDFSLSSLKALTDLRQAHYSRQIERL